MVGLLLWLNAHGFAECSGLPEVRRTSGEQTRYYMAWYQDGVIALSAHFDYDGLFMGPSDQPGKLARSGLLHELTHYCQARRDGPINPRSERAWLLRENQAYALQTAYLREHGSPAVLVWHTDNEG